VGRQIGRFLIFLTGYAMLLGSRRSFDVGFQLSFMATLGILLLPSGLGPVADKEELELR